MRAVLVFAVGCGFAPAAVSGGDDGGSAVDGAGCSLACPLGCDPTGTRCLELVPSNGIDPGWLAGPQMLDATTDVVIDTDAGTIGGIASTGYHQVAPAECGGGALVGLGVFAFSSVTIDDGVRVTAIGTRALALVSSGPIAIHGIIDVTSGNGCADPPRCAGPGGFAGGLYDAFNPQIGFGPGGGGHGYSNDGPGNESGGGGGAGCGAGGTGGDDGSGLYPPGIGGTPYMASALVPLCGGSGGGAGGPASYVGDPGSRGGGGGGAVQIVSASSIVIGGAAAGIRSGGGGGQGDKAQTIDDGGGGGGAGGAILIEAPTIAIDGVLATNGGGGGGGYNNGAIATDGEFGELSAIAAMGGPGVRRGGNGGAGTTTTGETAPGPVGDGGAGGGGGVGRVRLNTRSGAAMVGGMISPVFGACTTQGTITTR